ncbi:hypothetical protein M3D15_09680 [Pseudoclavibacter alba]|uniref:Mycofactocin biosynthesis chaperone MftB n=1 Tax=Pseudoclavibacter albus TaxID=272241 RepID=A0ABT2HZI7_9MICO|nr:hypothetical protein [Pseudoclavibacter alba]MCT2043591.1 hypothetical protein [Pseudoclavibacter alba]
MDSNQHNTGHRVVRVQDFGPEAMASVMVRRPGLYVGIEDPSAEQWRLIVDLMDFAAYLAGARADLTLEDHQVMQRGGFGQDKDELTRLLTTVIAALQSRAGQY